MFSPLKYFSGPAARRRATLLLAVCTFGCIVIAGILGHVTDNHGVVWRITWVALNLVVLIFLVTLVVVAIDWLRGRSLHRRG
jgi:hypothetical protein